MKSLSRQGRIEAGNHNRRIRRSTDLAKYPGFGWEPGSFIYTCLGYKIGLRFSQITGIWTCKCDELKAQTEIPHQSPQDIENILQNWINEMTEPGWLLAGLPETHGPRVSPIGAEPMGEEIDIADWMARPQAARRQNTPVVRGLAKKHKISLDLADEIMRGR